MERRKRRSWSSLMFRGPSQFTREANGSAGTKACERAGGETVSPTLCFESEGQELFGAGSAMLSLVRPCPQAQVNMGTITRTTRTSPMIVDKSAKSQGALWNARVARFALLLILLLALPRRFMASSDGFNDIISGSPHSSPNAREPTASRAPSPSPPPAPSAPEPFRRWAPAETEALQQIVIDWRTTARPGRKSVSWKPVTEELARRCPPPPGFPCRPREKVMAHWKYMEKHGKLFPLLLSPAG